MVDYIPNQGDLIFLTFDPQSGHEQKGRRPAIVISKKEFNKKVGLAIVCPITNSDRGYPFHIKVEKSKNLTGFIMVEQVKSIDYKARKAQFKERAKRELINEVLAILDAIIY